MIFKLLNMDTKTRNVKVLPSKSKKTRNSTTPVKKPEKQRNAETQDNCSTEEMWQAFEVELKWCVEQLESQVSKKCSQRQSEEASKTLKILTNPNAPLIKKRQLMRVTFGDYRHMMEEEEVKFKRDMKKINVSMVDSSKQKGTFIKKCAGLQNHANKLVIEQDESGASSSDSGHLSFSLKKSENNFRFDFLPPDTEQLNEI